MVDAMDYEYLLRRVYQVGRGGRPGANADEYRRLEDAESTLLLDKQNIENKTMRISTKSISVLEADLKSECQKVWRHVKGAINHGIEKYSFKFTDKEIAVMKKLVQAKANVTKPEIDNAILVAEDIFVKYDIYPA